MIIFLSKGTQLTYKLNLTISIQISKRFTGKLPGHAKKILESIAKANALANTGTTKPTFTQSTSVQSKDTKLPSQPKVFSSTSQDSSTPPKMQFDKSVDKPLQSMIETLNPKLTSSNSDHKQTALNILQTPKDITDPNSLYNIIQKFKFNHIQFHPLNGK